MRYGLDLLLLVAVGYFRGFACMLQIQACLTPDRVVLCAVSRGIVTAGIWYLARAFGDRILKLCERNRKIFLLILSMQHLSLFQCDVVFVDHMGYLTKRSLVLLIFFYLFLLFFLLFFHIREKGQYEQRVLEQKADAAQQKYDALVAEGRKRDLLVHDMRNHLIVLKSMLEEGETGRALGYIEGICRSVSQTPRRVETGNTVVDALLHEKAERAGEQGIRFRILVEELADGFVEDRDWCCILGNLLDNALEGSRKAEGERWIILRLENRPFGIVVSVENSCSGRLRVSEGKLKSTREDPKGHGMNVRTTSFWRALSFTDKFYSIRRKRHAGRTFEGAADGGRGPASGGGADDPGNGGCGRIFDYNKHALFNLYLLLNLGAACGRPLFHRGTSRSPGDVACAIFRKGDFGRPEVIRKTGRKGEKAWKRVCLNAFMRR